MLHDRTNQLLSVVIPALNEAASIERTLRQLVKQKEVDEIIVVDNGSDDGTPDIVLGFAAINSKVTLNHAPVRGIAVARNIGFDAARNELIARTDADTLVADDWGATICDYFSAHPETAALTGVCTYHDSPIDGLVRRWQQRQFRSVVAGSRQVCNMYGPNMAVRRSAWLAIRDDTQARKDVAEDLDMALCLIRRGLRIDQLITMRAHTSSRRMRTSPWRMWRFHRIGIQTLRGQGVEIKPIHWVIIIRLTIEHAVQWPLYRFWDFDRQRFSIRPGAERISSVGD